MVTHREYLRLQAENEKLRERVAELESQLNEDSSEPEVIEDQPESEDF